MNWNDDDKRKFREGFSGKKEEQKKKRTPAEKRAAFIASLTPEEIKERERKIASQNSYEDGGVCKKKSYFGKLKEKLKKK